MERESGTTVLEITVALSVLATVLAVFTGGLMQVFGEVNRTETAAVAQSQLHIAFSRLDKELRYAQWIRRPVDATRYAYVEYLTADTRTDQQRCNRLVVDRTAGTVRTQSWPRGAAVPAGQVLATGIVTDPGVAEFALAGPGTPDGSREFQQLDVQLIVRSGDGSPVRTAETFTARNTFRLDAVGTECTAGRPA